MRVSLQEKKLFVMLMAILAVISLMLTTWAVQRLGAWIVFHDSAEAQMSIEHDYVDSLLAEVFLLTRDFRFLFVEILCSAAFLWILWQLLFRAESNE